MTTSATTARKTAHPLVEQIPFVDLQAQYSSIRSEVDRAMQEVLASSHLILGPEVAAFEQEFGAFVGAAYSIGVSSGLDALRLALLGLDIGPGDEVILPANTFIASALAVSAVGAQPVLVDCDPRTYTIDPEQVARAITPRTAAVMPVHLAGQPADLAPLLELAERHGAAVIEDAAQAHGALYRGRCCGTIGTAGCFSFYPSKNLGAYGDGGMICTQDERLARRAQALRNYGQYAKHHHTEKGGNARLDTLQAAVLSVKLPHLAAWNDARARLAAQYRSALEGVGDLAFQGLTPDSTHVYHLFVVETRRRDALQVHLHARGIQTGIHYPTPIHLQPAFADLGLKAGAFPHTERLAREMLSLPIYPEMTEAQLERVVAAIKDFFYADSGAA